MYIIAPVILVGDDKGGVLSLKLSPNLRKISKDDAPVEGEKKEKKEEKAKETKTPGEMERAKMVKLLETLDTKEKF